MSQPLCWSRRRILQAAVPAAAGFCLAPTLRAETETLPPVRAITRGPKFHWFAYYDKLEFDATDRYVLGMEVGFEHRSPKPDDEIVLGMVDLADGDRWIELARTTAWCWQQGCMLQWLPGSADEVIYNDREGGKYVARILNVKTGAKRTVPRAIYAVSPDGRWAISTDFRRLGNMRPGYGYNGIPDPNSEVLAPKDSGVWRVDLATGEEELIVSIAQAAALPFPGQDLSKAKHWFNHLLVNTDGTRIEFLHRFKQPTGKGFVTRMFTADPDGKALRPIDQNGFTSHFIWRDPKHILAFSRQPSDGVGFYVIEDSERPRTEIIGKGVMTVDGHCTYLPGNQWVLCDTYPDKQRNQNVYLFHLPTGRRVWLGHFYSPKEYAGEWRCDTHPRVSRDGRSVVIDTPAQGGGRQLHLIDIRSIVST